MSPKIVAHQFDFSELAMEMAQIDDGIGDIRAQLREDMGKHHAEVKNQMLLCLWRTIHSVMQRYANIDRHILLFTRLLHQWLN